MDKAMTKQCRVNNKLLGRTIEFPVTTTRMSNRHRSGAH